METLFRLLLYLICALAVTTTSLCILWKAKIRSGVELVLGMGVLGAGQVILVLELLSLAGLVRLLPVVVLHIGLALPFVAWTLGSRAEIFRSISRSVSWPKLRGSLEGPLIVLLVAVLVAGALQLFLGLVLPPTTQDSMTYHLARIGYYLQQGSLDSFPTANIRQTVFPANSELMMLWQILLLGTDRTAALVQWLSLVGLVFACYSLAFQLGFQHRQAFFSALAVATFPQVLLQASSTQNDLFAGFMVVSAFAFVAVAGTRHELLPAYSCLAGIAVGIGIGTKSTVLLLLPGFVIFCLVCLRRSRRLLWPVVSGIAGFLAFGSYFYLQNLRLYGSPGGPLPLRRLLMLPSIDVSTAWSNMCRVWLQLVSPHGSLPPDGFTFLKRSYETFSAWSFRAFHASKELAVDFTGTRWDVFPPFAVHEEFAWFGPLFGWIGLPLLFVVLLWPGKQDGRRRVTALSVLVAFALLTVMFRWQPWHGRLALPFVALAAPLLAVLYPTNWRGWLDRGRSLALVTACVVPLLVCCIYNESKPLGGLPGMLAQDRIARMADSRPNTQLSARLLHDLDLKRARIGLVSTNEEEFEYLFFGERFEQPMVPLRLEADLLPPKLLADLDGLLFMGESQTYFLVEPNQSEPRQWVGRTELTQTLHHLRTSKDWVPLLDVDSIGHLFLRRGVAFNQQALDRLPRFLAADCRWWADKWVPPEFCLRVKIDAANPLLTLQGEFPTAHSPSRLRVEVPDCAEFKDEIQAGPGSFFHTLSLAPLVPRFSGKYALVQFRCDYSLNQKKQGLGSDARDLSWRLLEVQVTNQSALRTAIPMGEWWPDRWVGQDFRVAVLRDPTRPVLEFEGEFPTISPRLSVRAQGSTIGEYYPPKAERRTFRLDLRPVIGTTRESYVTLDFHVNKRFKADDLGLSDDSRDLGWRLSSLKLTK